MIIIFLLTDGRTPRAHRTCTLCPYATSSELSHRGEKGEDHACRDEQQADDFVPADGVAQIESREADGEDHLDLPDDPYQRGGGGREAGVPAGRADRKSVV